MRYTFILSLLLYVFGVKAQNFQWAKQVAGSSNEYYHGSATDDLGNLYLSGSFTGTLDLDPSPAAADTFFVRSSGAIDEDMFIVKLDPGGNFVWGMAFGSSGLDIAKAIAYDPAGYVVVCGVFNGIIDFDKGAGTAELTGFSDAFVLKLDLAGNYQWAVKGGGFYDDLAEAVTVDNAGNVITTGYFQSSATFGATNLSANGTTQGDVFVWKLNSSGLSVWAKGISCAGSFDGGNGVAADASRNVYVCGHYGSIADFDPGIGTRLDTSEGGVDAFVLKLDSLGGYVHHFTVGGNGAEVANDISLGTASQIHLTGSFEGTVDFDPAAAVQSEVASSTKDVFIAKYDAAGAYLWSEKLSGSSTSDVGYDIQTDNNNNVFVAGAFGSVPFIFKYNSSGSLQFSVGGPFGGSAQLLTRASTVSVTSSGDVYTSGTFYGGTLDLDPSAATVYLTAGGTYNAFIQKLSTCLNPTAPTIALSPSPACAGSFATLSIASGNLNGGAKWLWYSTSCGGVFIDSGFAITVPAATATYYARGEGGCAAASGPCGSLLLTTVSSVTPSVSIAASQTTICSGTLVTFTATAVNGGTTPAYQWRKGGVDINGATSATYVSSTLANNDVISCRMTSSHSCASPTSATSGNITMTVNSAVVPNITISSLQTTVCAGAGVSFTSAIANGGASPTYRWRLNGTNIPGATASSYNLTNPVSGDVVVCVLTSNAACATPAADTSNAITITVQTVVVPNITITTAQTTICNGTNVTFNASISNGGNTPAYQWKKNGVNISGANGSLYSSSLFANGDVISCVLTSSAACTSPASDTSNAVTLTVNAVVGPSITINASQTNVCAGTAVNFTATATNGGATPVYQWRKNGLNVGTNASSYASNSLANNDAISCVLTSNANCASPITDTSNLVTVTVNSVVVPSISISATQTTICSGTTVVFTASAGNGGSSPGYYWRKNGLNISGANSSTYSAAGLANGDQISCVLISNAVCADPDTVVSNVLTITTSGTVVPSVAVSASKLSICAGEIVTFTAAPTNGGSSPTYQWRMNGSSISGATSSTYITSVLSNTDTISCVLTSNVSCASPTSATSNAVVVQVNPTVLPSVSVSSSANTTCGSQALTFTAFPTNGGSNPSYQWKVNGSNVSGATSLTFTQGGFTNGDQVSVVMVSDEVCAVPDTVGSTSINITVIEPLTPSITIIASQTTICSGATVSFFANVTNGGNAPSYQWSINGSPVPGETSPSFSSSALAEDDEVSCSVTSSENCVTTVTAISNSIAMVLDSNVVASVAVIASDSIICEETEVTFTAVPMNGGLSPSYQWKRNGNNIPGANATVFTTKSLSNGDVISCEMTSIASCVQQPTVISMPKTIVVKALPDVSISQTGAQLTVAETGSVYQWIDCTNSSAITGATAQSYTVVANGNYKVMVEKDGCVDTADCVAVTGVGISEISKLFVRVFPNPSQGLLYVHTNTYVSIHMYNSVGVEALSWEQKSGQQCLDISQLSAGLYILRAKDGNSWFSIKVIKE